MNALDKVRESYYSGTEESLNKKTLALAYLQFCAENPGFHPDDRMDPENGVAGWHMLFIHRILTTWSGVPDRFRYPTSVTLYKNFAYEKLLEFHSDDEDEVFTDKVQHVYDWLEDMTVLDLTATTKDIEDLVMFHDGAPEEVFTTISDLSELLDWVNHL